MPTALHTSGCQHIEQSLHIVLPCPEMYAQRSVPFYYAIPHSCKPVATFMQDRTLLQDVPNMLVLVLLYMMQGVPLGLTMGAM